MALIDFLVQCTLTTIVLVAANAFFEFLAKRQLLFMHHQCRLDQLHAYLVPMLQQGVLLPLIYLFALRRRTTTVDEWWFGQTSDTTGTWIFTELAGYFVADCISHWKELPFLIKLHHFAGVLSCICAEEYATWRGLNITLAVVFEVGSCCINLADTVLPYNVCAVKAGVIGMFISTLMPWAWIFHGLICGRAPNTGAGWFLVVSALIGGFVRVQQAAVLWKASADWKTPECRTTRQSIFGFMEVWKKPSFFGFFGSTRKRYGRAARNAKHATRLNTDESMMVVSKISEILQSRQEQPGQSITMDSIAAAEEHACN